MLKPEHRSKNPNAKVKTLDAGNAQELFKSGEIRLKRKILEADMLNDVKDRGDYLNMFNDKKEHEERLLTLRDRRNTKKLQENAKTNNDNYLKNFEATEDPLDNTKSNERNKLSNLGSALKSKRYVSQ